MSIKFAILGFLSCKPMTGYDLKRVIQDSPFMHWSGNNNQIYKALQELYEEECVTNEVHHQTHAPSKKVYSISEKGRMSLKSWVVSRTELPEIKKTFLVQFAWADMLSDDEIDWMLLLYEEAINRQVDVEKKILSGGDGFSPERTPREKRIWELIHENTVQVYENELKWVRKVREEIKMRDEDEQVPEETTEEAPEPEEVQEEAPVLLLPATIEETALDKRTIELVVDEEVNQEIAKIELQRLLHHSIKVAFALEEQENLQIRYKEKITGFDREVGLKPGETI